MSSREYDNFDILLETVDAHHFRVRVTQCAVGDTPPSVASLPFSEVELENVLLKLDPGRAGTRRILDPYAQASVDLGGALFDSVFRDEVLVAWSRSLDVARERNHGMRLRLRLADAPALAGLPWEFLYDRRGKRFFAQSDRTPIVRYLDVPNPPRPLAVDGPLRILVIISSPHDLAELDVDREWNEISTALAEKQAAGLVVVDRLAHPSLTELQRWLRRRDVHVLHFVGHGDFDERTGDGVLAFCDQNDRSIRVTSAQLGTHVRDHDPLRLVVLNACQTATTDNVDAYSGMAQGLIQQEAAAVVAMQFPITDGAAIVFTEEFYGALADGEPVDQAVTSARKAMLADYTREWATPVLFLRAPDGRVFDRIVPVPPVESPVITRESTTADDAPPPPNLRPASPKRPATPAPPTRRPPRRRRWTVGATAAAVLAAGGAAAVAFYHGSGPAAPAGATSSGTPVRPSGGGGGTVGTPTTPPSSPQPAIVTVTTATMGYSGPSSHAYGISKAVPVPAGTQLDLRCAVYGEPVGSHANRLWYWTNHKWLNDSNVQTNTTQPVRNECVGDVNAPTTGTVPPSSKTGPFATVGHIVITIRQAAGLGETEATTLQTDRFVHISCHQSADWTDAPDGGTSSADWDQIGRDQWIPDADLLTGSNPGSPAPDC